MTSEQALANKRHYELLAEMAKKTRQMSPQEQSAWNDAEWTKLTAEPGGVDYLEVDVAGKAALWVVPKDASTDHVLFYVHGGGFVGGSIYTHRKLVGHLAKTIGCRALAVGYDYSYQNGYPKQRDQVMEAYSWLLQQGVDPTRIAAGGDSAGAAVLFGALLRARDEKLPLPAAVLGISGWFDMSASGKSYDTNREKDAFFQKETVDFLAQLVLQTVDPRDPCASAIFADLSGFPPIFLQAGEDETLVDDSRELARVAKAAKVEVRLDVFPHMLHSFQMMAGRAPEADDAIRRFATWVRPKLALGESAPRSV